MEGNIACSYFGGIGGRWEEALKEITNHGKVDPLFTMVGRSTTDYSPRPKLVSGSYLHNQNDTTHTCDSVVRGYETLKYLEGLRGWQLERGHFPLFSSYLREIMEALEYQRN